MNKVEGIKLLHNLRNSSFKINQEMFDCLRKQIDEKDSIIDRFFDGFEIEDNFHCLFSAMPWVKLCHELVQKQLPNASKNKYQVPDFLALFETNKHIDIPILLEVKSAYCAETPYDKSIPSKQVNYTMEYSKTLNIPLLYAIFWKKQRILTLNSIENFHINKNKHVITLFEAMKNDLSIIVGDVTFIIDKPIYRKSVYDKKSKKGIPLHEQYGALISDSVSIDNESFLILEEYEFPILDCIKMSAINKQTDGDKTILIEQSEYNCFLKLSTLILKYIAVLKIELNDENAFLASVAIIEFFKKIGINHSCQLPVMKTAISDVLLERAFSGSDMFEQYNAIIATTR